MVSPRLRDYIIQNRAAGYADVDIKNALLGSGWSAQDIGEGFATGPTVPTAAAQTLQPSDSARQRSNAAEGARIQEELRLEQMRQQQRSSVSSVASTASGMIEFLVRKGIAKDELQANTMLVGAIVLLLFFAWFFWPSSEQRGPAPASPLPPQPQRSVVP